MSETTLSNFPSSYTTSNGNDYSYDPTSMLGAINSGSARHDIGELKGTIRDAACETMAGIERGILHETVEFRHLFDRICATEKEAMNSAKEIGNQVMQNRFELAKVQADLLGKIDSETDRINDKAEATNRLVDAKFNALERQIAECCCKMEVSFKDARIATLEDQLKAKEQTDMIATLVSALKK